MYVIREVLNCKPGKVRQMVDKFRQISMVLKEMGHEPMRLLTDVTGEPFWTIVAEAKVEEECRRYETAIQSAGGIDLQLLGLGRTGHIGFNEPGSGAGRSDTACQVTGHPP